MLASLENVHHIYSALMDYLHKRVSDITRAGLPLVLIAIPVKSARSTISLSGMDALARMFNVGRAMLV